MFKLRSDKKELLDAPDIPAEHLEQNLRELHRINSWLGGYSTSISGLKKVLDPKRPSLVVDIGSGGGDTALYLHEWGRRRNFSLQIKGIDINPGCISYSEGRSATLPGVQFICDDYRNLHYHVAEADVLHASLFCHHLTNEEIIELLRFAKQSGIPLVINDLQRHPFAYYAIRILTKFFSRSHMVKNDAPLSVLRGFRKTEWVALLKSAGITRFTIRSRPMFRHEIVVYP